ncbi:hypothetical protein DY000_02003215 [Brassica cretica]|uniref:Uncharacterized protein n=1 Tax=Brassica cretica TaxID=69181 RepID=A0ABQ7CGE8_BRACR|nr:hypothetical protein DY000_02003215 [Brassica cretica]
MSVAELVRQPGRDHLPYLTPFNRSGNGISAWINRMMYSALDKGHPTFTDFPTDKQHLWFRQFAVPKSINNTAGRSCVRIGIRKRLKKLLPPTPPTAGATVKGRASSSITWVLNLLPLWGIAWAYTNKKTDQIDDGLVREVVTLVQTQVQDEVSQLQTEDDDSTASANLSRFRINEIVESSVPKKKGSLVGLDRRTRSVPPSSAPPSFVDPEMAAQQACYEAQRRLNQQMMEMMQRMYPNEVFPNVQDP